MLQHPATHVVSLEYEYKESLFGDVFFNVTYKHNLLICGHTSRSPSFFVEFAEASKQTCRPLSQSPLDVIELGENRHGPPNQHGLGKGKIGKVL